MPSFFDTLSDDEQARLQARSADLTEQITRWASRYSGIRPTRIVPVALLLSAVAPQLDISRALVVARLLTWIFLLDDRVDERAISLPQLRDRIAIWRQLARDGTRRPAGDDDELDRLLLEIKADLAQFPAFARLHERWVSGLCHLAQAMALECQYGLQWQAAASLPTLEEYLQTGLYSTGLPWWATTLRIVLGEPTALDSRSLNKAIEHAGLAIRLYNDCQSFEKEQHEGKIGAVTITYHALSRGGTQTDPALLLEARQHVWELGDVHARLCRSFVLRTPAANGQIEGIVVRAVAFHAGLFRNHNYHTVSAGEVLA